MNWACSNGLATPLEKLGIGLGFFHRYAESFWRATGLELDLFVADGEPWDSVARRIRGPFCQEHALHLPNATLCRQCFSDACHAALRQTDFHTVNCHAGQRFSICSLGDIKGAKVLILAGRVTTSDDKDAPSAPLSSQRQMRSTTGYQSSLDLLTLSLPYLKMRLNIDLLFAARELSPMVRKACHFIDSRFREKISFGDLAAACGVSEDYLSHTFSKQTGAPIRRYLAAVRTGHAIYLLRGKIPSIAEIAFECGFQSLSQFNRTFRHLNGMSPGEFRRLELGVSKS
jgi:AraC-like DNA-binding protein/ligand-binding sensor protein